MPIWGGRLDLDDAIERIPARAQAAVDPFVQQCA